MSSGRLSPQYKRRMLIAAFALFGAPMGGLFGYVAFELWGKLS